jgi:hypothetical protein
VRITYNVPADAVYIQLTDQPLTPGRTSIRADTPVGVQAFIVLDWKDHRLVGIESSTPAKGSTTTLSTKQSPSNNRRLSQPVPGRRRDAPPAAAVKAGRRPPAGQRP